MAEHADSKVPSALASLTKGGLNSVTKSLATEYAARGIRVNAVAPGVIRTPMHPEETHEFLAALHPVGRMGEIDDIVDAVTYLEGAELRHRRDPARRRRPAGRPLMKPWRVVGQGAAALAGGMGIGRFAYTPILPIMHAQAGLTPRLGAALATANYTGYLAGALAAIVVPETDPLPLGTAAVVAAPVRDSRARCR